ncbi:MAG: hypothetical protein KDA42_16080, partial [Planctomycetales bacterium]|nr:hypothetical protein [Planctomycetales bacterium]
MLRTLLVLAAALAAGCQYAPIPGFPPPSWNAPVDAYGAFPNPLQVPVANHDFAWDQIVDVVDDYFRIEHEQRVRIYEDVLTEGRIDTFPQGGATILEPHRRDSVGSFNRWESTLQTIRRRATLRVIPTGGGYLVDVQVEKELEDLPKPERSTTGSATFRNDGSLDSDETRDREPALPLRAEFDR